MNPELEKPLETLIGKISNRGTIIYFLLLLFIALVY